MAVTSETSYVVWVISIRGENLKAGIKPRKAEELS
jgi:hypothetical protein